MLPTPFAEAVLDLVAIIPPGRVMTYGDVAVVLGEGGARAVGTVMARFGGGVPWHRVVRADGRPAAGHEQEASTLLRAEGVPMRSGRVRLDACRWRPERQEPLGRPVSEAGGVMPGVGATEGGDA